MNDSKRLRVEDLRLPRLLEHFDYRRIPDEAGTAISLAPLMIPGDGSWLTLQAFLTLARTSRMFVIDHAEFMQIVNSAGSPPEFPELPPLPFPRTVFELSNSPFAPLQPGSLIHEGPRTFNMEVTDKLGLPATVDTIAVNETERGSKWEVFTLMRFRLNRDTVRGLLRGFLLRPDVGAIATDNPQTGAHDWLDIESDMIATLPVDINGLVEQVAVEFAHLVNARGMTVSPQRVPRAQHRRAARHRFVHPQVYFVHVGDTVEQHPGHGDREFHCRWLVRGHWRHPRVGDRIWVRPYIKGPAGAPWKGDPVHVLTSDEEIAA